jgi:hypothetical protein
MIKEKKTGVEKVTGKAEPVHTGDLDKALERIYQQYGNDLEAFFRDTKESILKRKSHTRNKRESYLL